MDKEQIYNRRLDGMVKNTKVPIPSNTKKEREFFIWLAGLLSSDGNLTHTKDSRGYYGTINIVDSSSERKWLDYIKRRGDIINLHSNICPHGWTFKGKIKKRVWLIRFETRKTAFFLKYYAKNWLMPRKLAKLNEYLSRPLISRLYNKMIRELQL